ncbi:MAG TPA: hypothetical protein DDW52_25520 [Planctomycetaceae bacterium]|nr:hypothetical protein [Planctomycetaceae bacterium]
MESRGKNCESGADAWSQCEPGLLTNRAKPTGTPYVRMAGLSAAVACGIVAVVFSAGLLTSSGRTSQALSCTDVIDQESGYFADNLAADERRRVNQHLLVCERCRTHYEKTARAKNVRLDLSLAVLSAPVTNWLATGTLSLAPLCQVTR